MLGMQQPLLTLRCCTGTHKGHTDQAHMLRSGCVGPSQVVGSLQMHLSLTPVSVQQRAELFDSHPPAPMLSAPPSTTSMPYCKEEAMGLRCQSLPSQAQNDLAHLLFQKITSKAGEVALTQTHLKLVCAMAFWGLSAHLAGSDVAAAVLLLCASNTSFSLSLSLHVCIYYITYLYICTYVCLYIYTYMHTYMYTHT